MEINGKGGEREGESWRGDNRRVVFSIAAADIRCTLVIYEMMGGWMDGWIEIWTGEWM